MKVREDAWHRDERAKLLDRLLQMELSFGRRRWHWHTWLTTSWLTLLISFGSRRHLAGNGRSIRVPYDSNLSTKNLAEALD